MSERLEMPEEVVVDLAKSYQLALAISRTADSERLSSYNEYVEALKGLEGYKVRASYSFTGIMVGFEKDIPKGFRPDFTRLNEPVSRQEAEVVIDNVRTSDSTVFVRFPLSRAKISTVAEQATISTLIVHEVIEKF
jgi:hypothetical protein